MNDQFSRTRLILGDDAMDALFSARVAIFGIGGVGSFTAEALARAGVGSLDIIDNDVISVSNINRQLYALHSTVGRYKTDIAKERIADINPDCKVRDYKLFFTPENSSEFDFSQYDYVVDAIDTVTGKLEIIRLANECKTPVISSMGTGNKLDPAALEVADIYSTSVCPLARVMRYELKRRGIKKLKVVYSKEQPLPYAHGQVCEEEASGRRIPGSCSFVPPAAGMIIAGEVIKDIIINHKK